MCRPARTMRDHVRRCLRRILLGCARAPRGSSTGPSWATPPRALRVEPFRLLKGLAEFPDLSGSLRGNLGYANQYVARDLALRQLLARSWLAPAVGRRNRAMLAQVIVEGLAVCLKSGGFPPTAPQ